MKTIITSCYYKPGTIVYNHYPLLQLCEDMFSVHMLVTIIIKNLIGTNEPEQKKNASSKLQIIIILHKKVCLKFDFF